MPEIMRRYRMITLRLFGQHEHKVAHNSSVSFGCSSANWNKSRIRRYWLLATNNNHNRIRHSQQQSSPPRNALSSIKFKDLSCSRKWINQSITSKLNPIHFLLFMDYFRHYSPKYESLKRYPLSKQNCVFTSDLQRVCYMSWPSYPPWFDHPNICCRVLCNFLYFPVTSALVGDILPSIQGASKMVFQMLLCDESYEKGYTLRRTNYPSFEVFNDG
jgi:hypothetical protein